MEEYISEISEINYINLDCSKIIYETIQFVALRSFDNNGIPCGFQFYEKKDDSKPIIMGNNFKIDYSNLIICELF